MEVTDRPRTNQSRVKSVASVNTNIIAKMGKNDPISMESLAKISTTLKCGLDDIGKIDLEDNL